jgi:hypothetical protein
MMSSRRVTAVLTRTLEVKAEQAMTAAASPTDREDEPPAGRRRRLLPAAAVVAVLALGAAGAIALLRDPADEQVTTADLGDPPDGWLVPGWVPDGMQLWGVDYSSSSGDERLSEPGTTIPQLFGDPDEGRAIYITSSQYEVFADTAEPVTVRGETGQAGRTWDVEENDVGDAVTWDERGATITAMYKGTTRAEAIAVLDSLQWRSDDTAEGFASPDDAAWALRGEGDSWPTGHQATFEYSEGVPSHDSTGDRPGLKISTEASSAVSTGYLAGWYTHGAEVGGGERPVSTFDDASGRLEVFWPDGRSIIINPLPGSVAAPSREEVDRIANSLTVTSEADLGALRDEAEANVAALPVLASGETTIGRVEVRGEGDFMRLCLDRPADGPRTCATDTLGGTGADWMIDGTWYVTVASTTNDFQFIGSTDASRAPDAGELPAETTTAGEWTIYLVAPPRDIEQVCLSSDGGNQVGCSFTRPGWR